MQTRQELYDLLGYNDYEERDREYFGSSRSMYGAVDRWSTMRSMSDPLPCPEIYSPGLEGVIAGETAISTITGGLQYRGYSVEDLAAHATFEEVAYLLLHGELPQPASWRPFSERLRQPPRSPPAIIDTLRKIPAGAPMMDVLRSGASLLAHWDPDAADNSHDGQPAQGRAAAGPAAGRPGGPASAAAGHRARRRPAWTFAWPATCCGCSTASKPPPSGSSGRWTCR